MPRPVYTDPEEEIPAGRWRATFAKIIRGKKGQKILRELEAFLLAMPRKKLIRDQVVSWGGGTCLIGEYVVAKQVAAGIERDAAIVELLSGGYDDAPSQNRSATLGVEFGIPWTLSWELAQANDTTVQELVQSGIWNNQMHSYDFPHEKYVSSPEERWASCLKLIQTWIKEGEHK